MPCCLLVLVHRPVTGSSEQAQGQTRTVMIIALIIEQVHILIYLILILTTALEGSYYFHPNFTDKEIVAEKN